MASPDLRFEIRPAVASDILHIKSLEADCGLSPWSGDDYALEIGRDGSVLLVAEERRTSTILGFIHMRLITIIDRPVDQIECEAEILNLAVSKAFRRRGIAKSLFDSATSNLPGGQTQLFLEVRASNSAAIELYAGLGFSKVGKRPAYYDSPKEDAVLMARQF